MTPAYLTEIEIIRELRLPERVGRATMARWKLDRSFPAPEPGTGDRRFWPAVERWLLKHHGLDISENCTVPGGEDNFDAWRKTRKARKPKHAGPDLPPPPTGMGPNVVSIAGTGQARVSFDDPAIVAAFNSRAPDSA